MQPKSVEPQRLTKTVIEAANGEAGKVVRLRHGHTRLFLRIDRRSEKIVKSWHFEREYAGRKIRLRLGGFPSMSVKEAEDIAKLRDSECDQKNDPREIARAKVEALQVAAVRQRAGKVSLHVVWNAYLEARSGDTSPLKPLTVRDYKRHIDKAFSQWAEKPISLLTKSKVENIYPQLVSEYGIAQANQAIRSLRAVLNWVLKSENYAAAIPINPVSALDRKLHEVKPRTNCLERSQIGSWWAAAESLENATARVYLRFLLLTGARREEALSLKWENVDFVWGTCTFMETKNGDNRCIPLAAETLTMLNSLPRLNEWVFASTPMTTEGVFASKSGRMAEPAKHIERIAKITGLHLSSHDLRRSFTTLCEWSEIPDGAVKQLIGHKPGTVTEQHYKVRPRDLLRMFMQRYENFILVESKIIPKKINVSSINDSVEGTQSINLKIV